MQPILQTATDYVSAGLSVIPIRADGSKAPALASWKPFQECIASPDELRNWFTTGDAGIAIIAGRVSGNLEVMDFDDGALLCACLEEADARAPGIVERLVIVATPSDGWHCFYRSDAIEGNLKLAQHQGEQRVETDIETRGEGGYVLAPGSPLGCHPLQKPYRLIAGSFAEIPFLNSHERGALLDSARLFNRHIGAHSLTDNPKPKIQNPKSGRPGDDYNARGDWFELLTRHGWRCVGCKGYETYWKRPGKDERGWSATVNYADLNLLYIFSSNAWPFKSGRAYSLFSAYAILEHGGDFRAASRELALQGYGEGNSARPAVTERVNLPSEVRA